MKNVKIPMTATRAMRLAKVGKAEGHTIASLLSRGLKNLDAKPASSSRKV